MINSLTPKKSCKNSFFLETVSSVSSSSPVSPAPSASSASSVLPFPERWPHRGYIGLHRVVLGPPVRSLQGQTKEGMLCMHGIPLFGGHLPDLFPFRASALFSFRARRKSCFRLHSNNPFTGTRNDFYQFLRLGDATD